MSENMTERITIPEFKTPHQAAAAVEAYFRQVLSSHSFDKLVFRRSQPNNFDPHKLHFSEIASECPRLAPLSAHFGAEIKPEPNGYFLSGHLHETLLVAALEAGHPDEFDFQYSLPNVPEGTQSHIDALWRPRKTIIEFKSAALGIRDVKEFPKRQHQLQLAGYQAFIEDLTGDEWVGLLVYTFRDNPTLVDVFPLPPHFKGEMLVRIQESIQARRAIQERGIEAAPAIPRHFDPERFPCAWYAKGGKTTRCKMWNKCWGDRSIEQPTPLEQPELQSFVDRLGAIKEQTDKLRDKLAQFKNEEKDILSRLAPHFKASPKQTLVSNYGEFNPKLVERQGGVDYDWKEGLKKGFFRQEDLAKIEYHKEGYTYLTWLKKKQSQDSA